jgi:hypothetical protein
MGPAIAMEISAEADETPKWPTAMTTAAETIFFIALHPLEQMNDFARNQKGLPHPEHLLKRNFSSIGRAGAEKLVPPENPVFHTTTSTE